MSGRGAQERRQHRRIKDLLEENKRLKNQVTTLELNDLCDVLAKAKDADLISDKEQNRLVGALYVIRLNMKESSNEES